MTTLKTLTDVGDGKLGTDIDNYEDIDLKVKQFEGLLNSINTSTDKKKALWREIYQNAITDRMHAYMMYVELYFIVKGDRAQHAMQGQNVTKAIERMSKANDQLIKLAEIIAAAESNEQSEHITPDDIYSKIKD